MMHKDAANNIDWENWRETSAQFAMTAASILPLRLPAKLLKWLWGLMYGVLQLIITYPTSLDTNWRAQFYGIFTLCLAWNAATNSTIIAMILIRDVQQLNCFALLLMGEYCLGFQDFLPIPMTVFSYGGPELSTNSCGQTSWNLMNVKMSWNWWLNTRTIKFVKNTSPSSRAWGLSSNGTGMYANPPTFFVPGVKNSLRLLRGVEQQRYIQFVLTHINSQTKRGYLYYLPETFPTLWPWDIIQWQIPISPTPIDAKAELGLFIQCIFSFEYRHSCINGIILMHHVQILYHFVAKCTK